MRKPRKEFTLDEDRFIIDNQSIFTVNEIASKLGRANQTVWHRRKLLHKNGLIKDFKVWSHPIRPGEEEFIRHNLWLLGAKECAVKLNRPYSTVYSIAKKLGLPFNPDFLLSNRQDITHFTKCSDPFVAYFLGLMWADGHISKKTNRICLKIKTSDFDNLNNYLPRLGDFWRRYRDPSARPKHHSPMTMFEVTHRDLHKFFYDNDYTIKSGASADKILSHLPENLRHYWWRGYFDGDGCISCRKISFNSGLDQDWGFVETLGKQLDITFSIERRDRGTKAGSKANIQRWHFIKKIVDYMYNGERFGFKRKMDRCFEYLATYQDPTKRGGHTSKYRGVSWCKRTKKYVMQISSSGKYIGKRYDNELEAAQAYDKFAQEMFGNKAILNFQ